MDDNSCRVLIIDDDPSIHDTIKTIFEVHHDSPSSLENDLFGSSDTSETVKLPTIVWTSAHQGKEGYELYMKHLNTDQEFDLVICDMRMPPGWDGKETIQKLAEKKPDMFIFICSAYSDYDRESIEKEAKLVRKLDLLEKPFNIEELKLLVTTKLELSKLLRAKNK